MKRDAFLTTLHADGPAADRSAQMMLYGRFIGSWNGALVYLDAEGIRRETTAEVHFGWVLEGRAIQDVWIAPSRSARRADERPLMHGSTLRVYDPRQDLWHITWIDPVRQLSNRMTGRGVGADIVQEYRGENGERVQWMFTDITTDAFHWVNRQSPDEGTNWIIRAEFFLERCLD